MNSLKYDNTYTHTFIYFRITGRQNSKRSEASTKNSWEKTRMNLASLRFRWLSMKTCMTVTRRLRMIDFLLLRLVSLITRVCGITGSASARRWGGYSILVPNRVIAKDVKSCGNALALNRRNSIPCTVRTSRQRSKGWLSAIVRI